MCPKQELLFRAGLMQATKYAKNAGPFVALRRYHHRRAERPHSCSTNSSWDGGSWNKGNPEQRLPLPTCTLMSEIKRSLFFFEIRFQTPPSKRQFAVKPLRVKRSRLVTRRGLRILESAALISVKNIWMISVKNLSSLSPLHQEMMFFQLT